MTASELVAVLAVTIFRSCTTFATGCYPSSGMFSRKMVISLSPRPERLIKNT